MADRFYTRHGAADLDGAHPDRSYGESDPLAELARLIGQSDPMADFPRSDQVPLSPRHAAEPQPEYEPQPDVRADLPPGPPRWVQHRSGWRKTTPVLPTPAAPSESVHPVAPTYDAGAPDTDGYYDDAAYGSATEPDPNRYDDALYGRTDPALVDDAPYLGEGAYGNDAYGYDDGYSDPREDEAPRRGKKLAVVAILALAVVGTGGAYAYRSLGGLATQPTEPPVIKADTAPVKVVPPTQAAERKLVQDRLASAGGTERLVPREETPVDVTSKTQGQPRIVFPPLTRNAAPATVAAASSGAPAQPAASAGPEPRKIRTVAVRPDQPAGAAAATAANAPAAASAATRPGSHAPVSLAPDSQTRTASINPTPEVPAVTGGYLVQVSSQRSEADARASFRILQGKFPAVLGNHAPVVKRADLGAKGVHYRAMVGPFGNQDQAAQFCSSLKSAGGQCFVQRN
jgi:hypothetical protein